MSILIGNIGLTLALLAAAVAFLASLMAGRFDSAGALKTARLSLVAVFGCFTLASIALLGALIDSNFSLGYVARFTEKALPMGYKLAAFWAGQEGSLLLWAWMIAAMAVIAALVAWKHKTVEQSVTTATLALICGFFAALMLFAANPFIPLPADEIVADGHGLNPMLQDPGMIAHPPLLFLGYAGFAIPFAMMVGALWAKRADNQWVLAIRRWTVAAWLFLTVGILLGAQWAYVELGWGGYWAWDPVENASLLPWLTGTALLHSIMVQQQRGMLKVWNAILLALTFILCIFGTYITRSGVVQSVHSFGKSLIGDFFLAFLITTILASFIMIIWRRRLLKAEHPLETIWGREGAFLVVNVLLLIMTAVTAVGTIFPAISEAVTGNQINVGQSFYNKAVVPMGVCLMALMAFGPLLSYGKNAAENLKKQVVAPVIGGVLVMALLAVIWRITNPWALATALIVGIATVSVLWDLAVTIIKRVRFEHENPLLAVVRTIDGNHRRYGGQTIHVGMLMVMIGIAGSSLYGEKKAMTLVPGISKDIGDGWSARLEKFEQVAGVNFQAAEATVLLRDPTGQVVTLQPQRRFYNKAEDSSTQVANWSTLRRDAYVTVAGWDVDRQGHVAEVTLEMIINPLVAWLWIGGIVMSAGGVLCLLPRLIPGRISAEAPEQVAAATIPVARKANADRPARAVPATTR